MLSIKALGALVICLDQEVPPYFEVDKLLASPCCYKGLFLDLGILPVSV